MKRLALLMTMGVFFSSGLLAQNFSISGGTSYSLALCANGQVISWGNNSQGQLGRATTKTATVKGNAGVPYDDVPTTVSMVDPVTKDPLTFSLIDAGSGGHAIARACDGSVYTWGGNEFGQLGNGYAMQGIAAVTKNTCSDIKAVDATGTAASICSKQVAQHVVAGETAGKAGFDGVTGDPYSGYLKNVVYVTSSTASSFAIVKDPKTGITNLLAWGVNDKTGTLIWGEAGGALGIGSADKACSYPRYVVGKDGKPLQNIIAVDAGDINCYAIIGDSPTATSGTVYGWGNNANNNIDPSTTTNPRYAVPIYTDAARTKPLTRVKMISAGDAFMLAYDEDKYLWSIGNEWMASTLGDGSPRGTGLGNYQSPKYATKVVAGEEITYNGASSFLENVTGIAAGQSSALAMVQLTISGVKSTYVMGWGGAYGSEDPAGSGCINDLGIKTSSNANVPTFAYRLNWRNGKEELLDSVAAISDGDGVMYVLREEWQGTGAARKLVKQLYVTGTNGAGQLGFPVSTKGTCVFTRLDLPSCDVAEPCAKADLSPMTICPASYKTAFAGSEGVSTYHYVWQRYDSTGMYTADGSAGWYEMVQNTPSDVTSTDPTKWTFDAGGNDKSTYNVDLDGYWRVSIYDTRKPLGCGTCPVTTDSALVSFAKTPIDTTMGTWCGTKTFQDTIKVLESSYKTANKKFLVYGSDVSTKALDTILNADFVGTQGIIHPLNIADLEKVNDTIYRYWVADSTRISSLLLDKTKAPGNAAPTGNQAGQAGINLNSGTSQSYYVFSALSDFMFKSFELYFVSSYGSITLSVTPLIYNAVKTATGYSPGTLVASLPATTVVVNSSTSFQPAVINVNTLLPGEATGRKTYILSFKVVGSGFAVAGALSSNDYTETDALGMAKILFSGMLNQGSVAIPNNSSQPFGLPTNWIIEKTTAYECGRIPIRVLKNCPPCTEPYLGDKAGSFKITATGTGLKGIKDTSGYVCAGTSITLTAQALPATSSSTTEYTWVQGVPSSSLTYSYSSASVTGSGVKTITAAAATTADVRQDWYLIARDSKNPTATMCYDTTHFAIVSRKSPTYTIIGGGSFCDYKGATAPDLTIQLGKTAADTVGRGPLTVKYSLAGVKTTYTTTAAEKNVHTFTGLADGTYKIDSIADKYCTVAGTESVDIQKVALADTAWTAGLTWNVCEVKPTQNWPLISVVAPAASATASYKYQWYFKPNGASAFATKGTAGTASSLQTDKQGLYYAEIQKTVTNKSYNATGTLASADLTCKSTVDADTVVLYKQPSYKIEKFAKYCAGQTITPIKLTVTADTVLNGKYGPWEVTPTVASNQQAAISIPAATLLTATTTDIDDINGLYYATVKNTVTGCSYVGKASVSSDTASIKIQDAIKMTIKKPADYCSGGGSLIDLSSLVDSAGKAFTSTVNLTYSAVKTGGADNYTANKNFAAQTVTTAGTDDVYDLKIKWQKKGEDCAAIVDTTLTVFALPTATLKPVKADVCLGDTVSLLPTLTGSHIGSVSTHKWEYTPATNGTISGGSATGDKTVKAAILTPTQAGAITLTYTITDDNKCVGTATSSLTGRDTPTVVIKAPKLAFCEYEDAATFTVTTLPAGGTGAWSSSVAAAISSTGSFDPKTVGLVKTAAGNKVKYAYTDAYNCKNADSVQVVINAAPSLAITNTKVEFCPYDLEAEIMFNPSITVDDTKFTAATGVSGGKFVPKSAAQDVATKVEYTYTDAATKCSTVVSKDFTVWKQTAPTLSLPDTLCLDGTTIDLTQYASNYTSTQKLTPSTVNTATTKGKVDVTYVYENAKACKDTVTGSSIVYKPATPTDDTYSELIKSTNSSWVVPIFKAKGIENNNTYKWFHKGVALTSFNNIDLNVENVAGLDMNVAAVHVFKLVQYRKADGCASDSATITFSLIDCPIATAPNGTPAIKCYDAATTNASDRTISAKPANTPTNAIHWFTSKTATIGGQTAIGESYEVPSASILAGQTAPQVISMYAFEFYDDGVKQCYTGGQEVKLTVHPKPTITVAISNMCYNSSPQAVTVSPSGGKMYINGAEVNGNTLDPSKLTIDKTKATTTLNVQFDYTSEAGCAATTVKQDIDIYYVGAPKANDTSISVAALKNGSLAEVTARLGIGATSLGWYENLTIGNTTPVSTASVFDTKKTDINKYYYLVSNVDAHGCRSSDSTKVILSIIECPTPAPKFVKDTLHVCFGKTAKTLEVVQEKDMKNVDYKNFKWYTSESGSARNTSLDNSLKYSPQTTATVDVWVSQEGSDGSAAGGTCEGPRTKATVQVNPMPTPSITLSAADVCLTGNTSVELTGSPVSGGSGYYTHHDASKKVFQRLQSNVFDAVRDTQNVAVSTNYVDTLSYVFTTKFACTDSATEVVKTHHVARLPKIADASYMREKITSEIKVTYTAAQKDAGAVINWSGDKTATGDELNTELVKESDVKTYNYSATQTVAFGAANCVSLPRATSVKLFDCPVKTPTIIAPTQLCTYSLLPTFVPTSGGLEDGNATADGSYFKYYIADVYKGSSTIKGSGSQDFDVVLPRDANQQITITGTSQNFVVKVTEYDVDYKCESPNPQTVTITVSDVKTPQAIAPSSYCAEVVAAQKPSIQVTDLGTNTMYIYKSDKMLNNNGVRRSTIPAYDYQSTLATWTTDIAATKGATSYWIAYKDNATGCVSMPVKTTLTVFATPSAPVLSSQPSCQGLALNPVTADTIVNWYWLNADAKTSDAQGNSVTPSFVKKDVAGNYTYWARKVSAEGCISAASEEIYTVKPQPAKVTFNGKMEVCSNALPFVMTVNGTSVAAMRDNNAQTMQGANQYQVTANDFDGVYGKVSFTQTVDGCTSVPELLPTVLVKNPTTTFTTLGSFSSCEGGSMVTMKAEGTPSAWGNVLWYLQPNQTDASAALQQGQKYKPSALTTTTSFYVHEYAKGQIEECHGPDSQIDYTIYTKPAAPTIIEPSKTFYCQDDFTGISQLVLTAKSNAYDANNVAIPGTYVWKRDGVVEQGEKTDKFPVNYIGGPATTISAQFVIKTSSGAECPSDAASLDLKTVVSPSIERIYDTKDSTGFPNRINVCEVNKVELKARCYRTTDLTWTITLDNSVNPPVTKDYSSDGLVPVEFDAAAEGYVPGVNYPLVLTVAHTFTADVNGKTKSVDCYDYEQGYLRIIKTPKVEIIGSTKTCESLIKDYRYTAKVLEGHVDSLVWPDPKKIKWESVYDKTKDPLVQEIRVLWQEPKIDTITLKALDKTWGCYGETALPVQVARKPSVQFTYDIPGFSTKVRFLNETTQDSITGTQYDPLTQKFVPVSYPVYNKYYWDFGRDEDKSWVVYDYKTDSVQRVATDAKLQNLQKYEYGFKTVVLRAESDYGCSVKDSIEIFVDIKKGAFMPNAMCPSCVGESEDVRFFKIKAFNFESYKVTVYDQWGNILWTSSKLIDGMPAESWDGTYGGQYVKEDVYIWHVEGVTADKREYDGPKYGNIVVLRKN